MNITGYRRKSAFALTFGLSFVALLLGSLAIPLTAHALSPAFTPVANSVEPWTISAQKVSSHKADDQLTIGLLLKAGHPDQQQALLQSLYNSKSAQYHQWLTPEDFAARFAPATADVAAAKSFLTSAGLKLQPNSDDTLLLASGTTAQIETALHTQINDYQLGNVTHYGNSTNVQVPSSLGPAITGFFGLSDLAPMQSSIAVPDAQAAQAPPPYGGGPNGSGLTPSQINSIYNATPVNNMLNDKGQVQTLAVYELSGYKREDIRVYEKQTSSTKMSSVAQLPLEEALKMLVQPRLNWTLNSRLQRRQMPNNYWSITLRIQSLAHLPSTSRL